MKRRRYAALPTLLLLFACKGEPAPKAEEAPKKLVTEKKVVPMNRVDRETFNRLAAELALPLFWISDDGDATLSPKELAVLWRVAETNKSDWLAADGFTDKFVAAYEAIVARKEKGMDASGLPEDEAKRRELVLKELAGGRPTLVYNDFSKASAEDKAIVRNILDAAILVEKIHAKQNGVDGLEEKIPADDMASRMLFYRNQGPWCVMPETENEEACTAMAPKPPKISGLYPR